MTAHELARQLLAGQDLPVTLQVNTSEGGYWSDRHDQITVQPTNDNITLLVYSDNGGTNDDEDSNNGEAE